MSSIAHPSSGGSSGGSHTQTVVDEEINKTAFKYLTTDEAKRAAADLETEKKAAPIDYSKAVDDIIINEQLAKVRRLQQAEFVEYAERQQVLEGIRRGRVYTLFDKTKNRLEHLQPSLYKSDRDLMEVSKLRKSIMGNMVRRVDAQSSKVLL